MERQLLLRGVLVGALGSLLVFIFARIFAEPQIESAIAYEAGRDATQAVLDKAAGLPTAAADPDIFSRTLQSNLGAGVGMILFGVAVGALFAVTYAVCLGRVGNIQPRVLALLVSAAGFLAVYLVPFVKYPANPPAIGSPDTIKERGALYLLMVFCSVLFLVAAVWLGQRLGKRFGNWNASALAGATFVVAIGIVIAILPSPGHLAGNEQPFGHQTTETPLPLTNASGAIVYPGFPADVLFDFRLYSVAAQLILWATIGLVFAPMAERLLKAQPGTAKPERLRC